MSRAIALAFGLTFVLTSPAAGQFEISISPVGGAYLPTADVLNQLPVDDQLLPVNISQKVSFLVGGRLGLRFSRLGVEAEALYSPSNLDITNEPTPVDDASVFLGSVNLIVVLFEAPFSPFSVHATGGVGLAHHGGDLMEFFEDTTDPAGTLGLGIRFGLSPLAHLRFDVRDYIYSFEPTVERFRVDLGSELQNDIIATVALEFGFSPTP